MHFRRLETYIVLEKIFRGKTQKDFETLIEVSDRQKNKKRVVKSNNQVVDPVCYTTFVWLSRTFFSSA